MTLESVLHYIEVGVVAGAPIAITAGAIGHALAALPWTWAKVAGNFPNAISVDFGDILNSVKNAKIAQLAKKVEEEK